MQNFCGMKSLNFKYEFKFFEVKIGIYHIQNFYNCVSNEINMAENIYHLESKRVENSVFPQEIGGENGIFSKKRRSGGFGIFSNSTV